MWDTYEVGLIDIDINPVFNSSRPRPKQLYISGAFVNESQVGRRLSQVLRRIAINTSDNYTQQFSLPLYFPVTGPRIDSFLISVLDENLELAGLEGECSLTLHLRPRWRTLPSVLGF